MLIYSASARRVVAINGNMMAPARATIAHYPRTRHRLDSRRRAARGRRSRGLRRAGNCAARLRHQVARRRARARAAAGQRRLADARRIGRRPGQPFRRSNGGSGRIAAEQRETVSHRVAVVGARLSARRQSPAAGQRAKESRAREFFQARARRRISGEESRARGGRSMRRAIASIAATSRAKSSHGPTPTAACSARPTSRLHDEDRDRPRARTTAASPSSSAGRGHRARYFCSSSSCSKASTSRRWATTPPSTSTPSSRPPSSRSPIARPTTAILNSSTCRSTDCSAIDTRAIRRTLIDPAHASMDQRPGDPVAMRALRDAPAADARPWGGGTIHVTPPIARAT